MDGAVVTTRNRQILMTNLHVCVSSLNDSGPAILRLIRAGLFAGVRDEALRFRRVKRRDVVVLEERFEERGTLAGGLRRT